MQKILKSFSLDLTLKMSNGSNSLLQFFMIFFKLTMYRYVFENLTLFKHWGGLVWKRCPWAVMSRLNKRIRYSLIVCFNYCIFKYTFCSWLLKLSVSSTFLIQHIGLKLHNQAPNLLSICTGILGIFDILQFEIIFFWKQTEYFYHFKLGFFQVSGLG